MSIRTEIADTYEDFVTLAQGLATREFATPEKESAREARYQEHITNMLRMYSARQLLLDQHGIT